MSAARTLFHPFQNGTLVPPGRGERVLFFGARPGFVLPEGVAAELDCVQGLRPDYLGLSRAGLTVAPSPEGDGYDAALVLASRHRAENEMRLAEAVMRVRAGGLVVMAGGKEDGVGALRERLAKGGDGVPDVPLGGHMSKHHGVVFWLVRSPQAKAFAEQILARPRGLVDDRFRTAPGSFSHDRIDPGSLLLVQSLPGVLGGSVADFCAGWGFLAVEVGGRATSPLRIDLYEADHASLRAARDNMDRLVPGVPTRFFWHDLVAELVNERYDTIVMNPPFHRGRAAEPGLGVDIIVAASRALRRGGRLFMVANRQLPYETCLARSFSKVEKLREEHGFKVFSAVR